jgi:hypothetical protein
MNTSTTRTALEENTGLHLGDKKKGRDTP